MTEPIQPNLLETAEAHRPNQMTAMELPKPGTLQVIREAFFWLGPFLRFIFSRLYGRYVLRVTEQERAERSARLFSGLGLRGRFLAQIAARRIDLLPIDVCLALRRLEDDGPPLPLETVRARIAEKAGRPIDEVLAHIEPTPFKSSSLFCGSYRARLVDGRAVVIKMRRPGVTGQMMATLAVLNVLWRIGEMLTLAPQGTAKRLEADFRKALEDDLDLRWQGQLQAAFRRKVKEDRVPFVTTAKVVGELLDHDLLVTRFEEGIPLPEIIRAVDEGDEETLLAMRAQGIKPRKVARRLLYLSWWSTMEGVFFIPDPNPRSIVVKPDGRLLLTSMSSGDVIPNQKVHMLRRILERLGQNDVSRAGFAMLHLLSPLPNLDTYDLGKKLETLLHTAHYRTRNPHSTWADRTTLAPWKALLDTAKRFRIPIRQPVVRAIRGEMNYSLLAGMVWRDLDVWQTFRRYRERAYERVIGREMRRQRRAIRSGVPANLAAGYRDFVLQLDDSTAYAESLLSKPPIELHSLSRKGSYAASVYGQAALLVAGITAGVVGLVSGLAGTFKLSWATLEPTVTTVCTHPAYLVFIWCVIFGSTRMVLARVNDVDVN